MVAPIRSPADLQARWRAATAAEGAGDLKAAEAGYRAILAAAPRHPPALRRLAGIGRRYGDAQAAGKLLERALAAEPAYWPARLDLADIRHEAGELEAAAPLYAAGLAAADPPDAPRLSNYAALLLKLGRHAEALEMAERHGRLGVASANVSAYRAQALWELGRDADFRALADPEVFAFPRRPAPPEGYANIAAFNADLVAALEAHPTLTSRWDPARRAARGGRVTGDIFADGAAAAAPIRAFRQMIEREVSALAAELPDVDGHPFYGRRPKRPSEIVAWANLMPADGVQASHIHNLGWLSGVYYPKLPETFGDAAAHAGWLGFGRPGYGLPAARPPLERFVRPETGLMGCFPSYVWHWTEPFEGAEERVSVAFDVA